MKIKNMESRIHHIGPAITLLPDAPGIVNDVDEAEWAKVKDLAVVKHHLREGNFVIVAEKKAKE